MCKENDECVWTLCDDFDLEYYSTTCGEEFCITEGTPKENHYNYCPQCGAKLIEQPPKEK